MERQEFDLSDYSLEVRDGKAVLERKEGFKPGDVLSGVRQIAIYADTAEDGTIITYCGYDEIRDIFTDKKDVSWGYTKDFRYATKEQEKMLFAEIEKRGYVWDAEKLELRKKEFEDGAFLVDTGGYIFIHWTGGDDDGGLGSLAYWNPKTDDMFIGLANSVVDTGRLATEEERQSLLDRLAKEDYEWDSERKRLRKKRWRAKKGEGYWIVASHGKVERYAENDTNWDYEHYSIGNYFRTREEAEQVAEEVRNFFEKYKEE